MRRSTLVASFSIGLAVPGIAAAVGPAIPTVIFSNIASSTTSDVPGLPGKKFNPGTSTQFDRPFTNADGSRWIFGAIADDPVADLDIIVVGGGTTGGSAATPVKEGDAIPGDPATLYTSIRTQMGINLNGAYTFNGDTNAATGVDDVAVRWNGAAFDLIAREGTQAPGQPVGNGYGSLNNASHILENGNVRFRSAALTGNTTQQVLYENTSIAAGAVVAQTDVTSPAGQLVAPAQTIDNLTSDRFISDATGAHYLYHADLNGPTATDLVMVHDGTVVAQEGVVLPSSGFVSLVLNISGDAGSQQISKANDHYLFRGSNADTIDWVVKNGSVVAVTDGPIFTGSAELWDDATFAACFFINTLNSNGDYVIGGVSNNADLNRNGVLVLNGQSVLLREGDPVDVNGNGLFDDDAFLSVFNNDDSFLTDDLLYYFNADLRNSAGASIGQAFLVVAVPEPGMLSLMGLGMAAMLRRRAR